MSRAAKTPIVVARRHVTWLEAEIDQQRLLICQLAADGRSTVKAKQDLGVMERSLILLLSRMARLTGVEPDASP
jgi:hypothetical protein